MLSSNIKMKKFTVTLIIFVSVLSCTLAHRCYVCGRDAEEPFKDRPKSKRDTNSSAGSNNSSKVAPKCDTFERGENVEQFVMECPSGYTSCLTQIDGPDVMRTCAEQQLNDCATANDIIYCYCKDELCNSQKAKSIRDQQKQKRKPEIPHVKTPPPTDDEDLEESSGLGEISYPTEMRKKQLSPLSSSASNEHEATSKKNYMITLKPATDALNLTTTQSPKADATSTAANTHICSHTLSTLLIMLANLIIFLRIN